MTDRLRLLVLLGLELLVVMGLHALGRMDIFTIDWSDLGAWIEETRFDDVAGSIILLGAQVLAYWVFGSTAIYTVAEASGRQRLIGVMRRATPGPIRRLANRAVALSFAATVAAGPLVPAVAELSDRAGVIVEIGPEGQLLPPGTAGAEEQPADEEAVSQPAVPPHLWSPGTLLPPQPPEQSRVDGQVEERPRLDGSVPHSVTVQAGDHMWSLSEQHLQLTSGREALADPEIARYWVRVMDENRCRIRSGNPDLIYPGEVLVLPPV